MPSSQALLPPEPGRPMIDVGHSVGHYNIIARLGEGGMGTVFLAEHPVIGSKVAIKVIHPQLARNTEVVSRFVTEATSVNQIGHDHIVNITDFGTAPTGDFYFIMEYLDGDNLLEWIKRVGALPPARALDIAAQIADALNASHEHGVIHRDLKPENIFLIKRDDREDFVKVLDFGLAKLTHVGALLTPNTQPGSVMGSPYYMSPEQCEGRAEIDLRADIYSLGVILFEMLTGKVPFGGEGYGEILVKHVAVQAPTASSIVPQLPRALDLLLFRAMAKDPRHRFQTMAEFRAALLAPERYESSAPPAAIQDDMSVRVRAAMPMARTEMTFRPTREGRLAGLETLGVAPTTFQHAVGEVGDEDAGAKSPRRLGRIGIMVGVVAVAAAAGVKYRREATRFLTAAGVNVPGRLPRGVALATVPSKPTTVRVNFNSDPDGATVAGDDGARLGTTPLSIEVPYGETAIEYIVRKEGYSAKTEFVVPNMPSPVFAVLRRSEPAAIAPLPAPASGPTTGSAHGRSRLRPAEREPASEPDSDDSLDPSYR